MATVTVLARVPPLAPVTGGAGLPSADAAIAALGADAPPGLAAEMFEAARAALESRGAAAELAEFLRTWRSNGRPMVWARMTIEAGAAFPIHCHPNIEVVYVLSGALREDRLRGPPRSRGPFAAGRGASLADDLSECTAADFEYGERTRGSTIVNEIGSVHRSYCGPDEGCDLLALWGGCHASVARPPRFFDPPKIAVDEDGYPDAEVDADYSRLAALLAARKILSY